MQEKSQLIVNQSEKIAPCAKIVDKILEKYQISGRKFAEKVGMTASQISDYRKGKLKRISPDIADRIIKEYPELSRVWLLTGEGAMLKSVRVEGSGNATVNGDHSTATIGVDGSRLLDQLDRKDEQIRNATEQVNRLLAIIERMQGA